MLLRETSFSLWVASPLRAILKNHWICTATYKREWRKSLWEIFLTKFHSEIWASSFWKENHTFCTLLNVIFTEISKPEYIFINEHKTCTKAGLNHYFDNSWGEYSPTLNTVQITTHFITILHLWYFCKDLSILRQSVAGSAGILSMPPSISMRSFSSTHCMWKQCCDATMKSSASHWIPNIIGARNYS